MTEQNTIEFFLKGSKMIKLFNKLPASVRLHSNHVAVICTIMEKYAEPKLLEQYPGISPGKLKNAILIGARYHDIGRLYLPDKRCFDTADNLDEIEKKLVQRYPSNSLEIIQTCVPKSHQDSNTFKIVEDMCYCHDERFDGSGFPRGISGEEIPVAGRICGIADMLDSCIVYKRSPRISTKLDNAFSVLSKDGKTLFGEDVFGWLNSAETEIRNIYSPVK